MVRPRKLTNLSSSGSPISPAQVVSSPPSSYNFPSPPSGCPFPPVTSPTSPTSPTATTRCQPPQQQLFDALGLGAAPTAPKRTAPKRTSKQLRLSTSTGVPDRKREVPPVPALRPTQLSPQTFSPLSATGMPSSDRYASDLSPSTAADTSPTDDVPLSPESGSKVSSKLRGLSHKMKWRLSQPSLGQVARRTSQRPQRRANADQQQSICTLPETVRAVRT